MITKLRNLVWFLKRPHLMPQVWYLFIRKFRPGIVAMDSTGDEALRWCRQSEVDMVTAYRKLTNQEPPAPILDLYSDVFANAEKVTSACVVRMGGAGAVDMLYWISEYLQATRILETGVAYGWSSLAFLLSIEHRPEGKLVSVDMPYVGMNNDEHIGCAVPDSLRAQWTLLKTSDRQGVPAVLRKLGTLDICHYDSDKSYQGRMWAYPLLWNALRSGGIFVSDDIGDNVAFRDFCASLKIDPVVFKYNGKFVGMMTKP
ncbi:class I SAM-dependent methyltransferase [bacterium]|nr:class I SAM-dependent methyltransferase [bacterium]